MSPLPAAESHRWLRIAFGAWAVFLVVILVVTVVQLGRGTVTHNYRDAARAWWRGETLYAPGHAGFLYAPQAAIVWTPFAYGPEAIGEVLWRVLGVGLLAWGAARLSRAVVGDTWPRFFLFVTVISLAASAGAARNGQSSLHMIALMAHACADLAASRWNRAAVLISIAVAIKPLAVVMAVFALVAHPRAMWWRLAIGGVVVAAFPFAAQLPSYVINQYNAFLLKMSQSADVKTDDWSDIAGIARNFSAEPDPTFIACVRAAALAVLGVVTVVARRRWSPGRAAVVTLASAALMITVFNPRCESNTYVVLILPLALIATWLLRDRRLAFAIVLLASAFVLGFSQLIAHGEVWPKPSAGLAFFVVLACGVLLPRAFAPRAVE